MEIIYRMPFASFYKAGCVQKLRTAALQQFYELKNSRIIEQSSSLQGKTHFVLGSFNFNLFCPKDQMAVLSYSPNAQNVSITMEWGIPICNVYNLK